jgi:CBS-domain-containing membrane protein
VGATHPVVDERGQLVGIVSQAEIVVRATLDHAAERVSPCERVAPA